ncbi:MAG: hypothetical protein WD557_02160 [Dehalococcoidia bacterium]
MSAPRFPLNASLYEAMRTHPGATARLSAVGLTREFYDYTIVDAARAVGVPLDRVSALLESEPAPTAPVSEHELVGV